MKASLHQIGAHLSISDGYIKMLDHLDSLKGNAVQFFTGSPRTAQRRKKLSQSIVKTLKKKIHDKKIYIVAHSAYTINIAKPPSKNKSAIKSLIYELNFVSQLGNGFGAIVHIGKKLTMDKKTATKNMINTIKLVLKDTPKNTFLILENAAGQGTEMYSDLVEFINFYYSIPRIQRKRIRLCIDTCHLFASGQDFSSKSKAEKVIRLLKKHLDNPNIISCIHFNDSKVESGTKVDRHEDIGCGKIGSSGLKVWSQFAKQNKIPLILETPESCKTYREQIKLIKTWTRSKKKNEKKR